MKVRDIVRHRPHVWTISPDATVQDALELLAEKDIGALPIVSGENLIGIFTEHGFVRKCIRMGCRPHEVAVSELMRSPVLTISPEAPLDDCLTLMTIRNVRYLPVMENHRMIGIVSIGDIVRAMLEEKDVAIHQLEGYIIGYGAGVPV